MHPALTSFYRLRVLQQRILRSLRDQLGGARRSENGRLLVLKRADLSRSLARLLTVTDLEEAFRPLTQEGPSANLRWIERVAIGENLVEVGVGRASEGAYALIPDSLTVEQQKSADRLRRPHARNLFELYCYKSIEGVAEEFSIGMDDLRDLFALSPTNYPRIGQFYHWVMDKAVEELRDVLSIDTRYQPVHSTKGKGGRVLSLTMGFHRVAPKKPLAHGSQDHGTAGGVAEVTSIQLEVDMAESRDETLLFDTPSSIEQGPSVPSPVGQSSSFWWPEVLETASAPPYNLSPASVLELLETNEWPRAYWIWALDTMKARVLKADRADAYTKGCLEKMFPEWCKRNKNDGFDHIRDWWAKLSVGDRSRIREKLHPELEGICRDPLREGKALQLFEACALAQYRHAQMASLARVPA